ncbi:MAG: methyltransferase type 12 [Alphaproteobacteria bacterium HGW-Alphaproteobacteria-8]|nr:MAG: methyltransferase type 12 [Alphaproteobacteria bacterium HGW-Alphaproteobacteria-8]
MAYPAEPTALHDARLSAVRGALAACGAASVMDLGCGDGALLIHLAALPGLTRILGVELDAAALIRAAARPEIAAQGARITLVCGSLTNPAHVPAGFDAAVLVEVIEHLPPDRLGALERAVFAVARPGVVILTTPNADFNGLLGVPAHRRRHPDHRFEWGRAKFRDWASGVARRAGYATAFSDVPCLHADLGGPSQMAVFTRAGL